VLCVLPTYTKRARIAHNPALFALPQRCAQPAAFRASTNTTPTSSSKVSRPVTAPHCNIPDWGSIRTSCVLGLWC